MESTDMDDLPDLPDFPEEQPDQPDQPETDHAADQPVERPSKVVVGGTSRRKVDTSQRALLARLRLQGSLTLRIVLQVRATEAGGYSPVEGYTTLVQVGNAEGLERVKRLLEVTVEALSQGR